MIPTQNRISPHVTGNYGENRANGPHGGTDFKYDAATKMANLYADLLMAITKPCWAKDSPSGDVVQCKDSIPPLLCPKTSEKEVFFWIEFSH
jgi:hypothetical protein